MAQGTTSTTAAARREPLLVDLALRGGGAHGAFTWGVIDRLLEEPWLEFDGISGTSAGAMNTSVMADGFAASGREGARVALEAFWRRVARAATFSPHGRNVAGHPCAVAPTRPPAPCPHRTRRPR
jgi:NTE family protein